MAQHVFQHGTITEAISVCRGCQKLLGLDRHPADEAGARFGPFAIDRWSWFHSIQYITFLVIVKSKDANEFWVDTMLTPISIR